MTETKSIKTKNDVIASKFKEKKGLKSAISADERSKKFQQHHAFDPRKYLLMKNRNKRNIPFTIGYHIIFWIVLGGITTPFFYLLSTKSVDARFPAYFGLDAFIGNKPKLNIFPKSITGTIPSGPLLIELSNETLKNFTRQLRSRLEEYANQTIHRIPCTGNSMKQEEEMIPENDRWKRVCSVDLQDTTENTGFGECSIGNDNLISRNGKPCFMLVFNKILGIAPKSKLRNGIDTVNGCHSKVVPITCKSDSSNVALQVYPKDGISSCMWPYVGQPDYIPPFAMLQMSNIPLQTKIKIWCYADVDDLQIKSDDEIESAGHILKFFITNKINGKISNL